MKERPPRRTAFRLRRYSVLGRSTFTWRIVVARFAVPVATLATLIRAASEPFTWTHFATHVAANLVAAVTGGYIAGRVLWALVVSRASPFQP